MTMIMRMVMIAAFVVLLAGANASLSSPSDLEVVASIDVGLGPIDVSVNPLTNRVYVANQYDDTVTVIDGDTNETVASIWLGYSTFGFHSPQAVEVNPFTNRVYVANAIGTVTVIDGTNNTILDTLSIGRHCADVAVNPLTNEVYVITDVRALTVIDGSTHNIITTISFPYGRYVYFVEIDAAVNRVYVTGNFMVWLIDGNRHAIASQKAHGFSARGLAVSSCLNRVYVLLDYIVRVYDGGLGTLIGSPWYGGVHGIAENPYTRLLFVTRPGRLKVLCESPAGSPLRNCGEVLGTGSSPYGIDVNPYADRIYIANTYSNTVTVVDGHNPMPRRRHLYSEEMCDLPETPVY